MQMRFHATVGNEFIDQTVHMLLSAYTQQLNQIPVVQTAQHLNLSQELSAALLIFPLKNLYGHTPPVIESPFVHTSKTTFTDYFGLVEFVCSSFHLRKAKCSCCARTCCDARGEGC